jgi:Protein of unknown function (DUF3710).
MLSEENRASSGPFDVSEVGQLKPYIDFGSIRLSPNKDVKLRAELDEKTKKVVAITVLFPESTMQLQAFAAPKSAGIWSDALDPIQSSISKQGGAAEVRSGLVGQEIRARVPVDVDGKKGFRESVFIGVDGPRWMLRGVIYGKAASDNGEYQTLIEMFRSTVVDRGNVPLPPNELLPLRLPQNQAEQSE